MKIEKLKQLVRDRVKLLKLSNPSEIVGDIRKEYNLSPEEEKRVLMIADRMILKQEWEATRKRLKEEEKSSVSKKIGETIAEGEKRKEKMEQGLSLKDLRVRELLKKAKPRFQSLGMGICNGRFYYGTKIYDDDGKPHDAIITSDRKIYIDWVVNNEIKDFGLNYRWPFFDSSLDMQWSNSSINAWLYDNVKVDLKKVYERILEKNKFFMDYPDERWHKFVALDILSTYFTEIFEHKGRTLICAEPGSGKTRQTELYRLMAFNSAMSIDWTEASIFRTVESTKASILIDNFDEIPEEVRKSIMIVFRAYRKVKTVRTEGDRRKRPLGFDLFTSMVLNNILGLDPISEDRARKIKILKSKNKEIVNRKIDPNNPEWQEIRDSCYICGLHYWEQVQSVYRQLIEDKLIGRELEIYEDVLTLAKLIDKRIYDEVLSLILSELKQKKICDLTTDYLYLAVEAIFEKMKDEKVSECWVKIADIVDCVAPKIYNPEGKNYDSKKRSIAIYLGRVFRNCPLFKGRQVKGTTEYFFTLKNLLKFADLKEFGDLVDTYSTLSTNSTYSTLSTNSTLSTYLSDNSESKEVECVEYVDKEGVNYE